MSDERGTLGVNGEVDAETPRLKHLTVRGVVQGVGFRPFVYQLARAHGLTGWVLNHSGGVEIEVEGTSRALEDFARDLCDEAPPLARIVSVESTSGPPTGHASFEIRHSVSEEGRYQLISPDIATCTDCLQELLDPRDRRFRYPFTNCTNCGPRFTIIRDIPYDRPLTTMQPFPMCASCQAEYKDPLDRRFHAQPNACPVCGPKVWLEDAALPGARQAEGDEALRLAGGMLLQGKVLAIKGLGGFHLACDATNADAVRTLRSRKGRPAKPLAVMVPDLEEVHAQCQVTDPEEELLSSQQCPIVLLRWRHDSTVVREVAPGNLYLGVMLPYTPLHHILLRDVGRPLVMTSGNLSEEPIAKDNDEARRRLASLVDAFVMHNRDIYARYDDSVWFVPDRSPPQPLRRSRGYAPFPVRLPSEGGQILATGAELKNSFCVTRDDFAFLSQHIGDMENIETLEHFEATIELYRHLFRTEPERVAHDLHPDYLGTQYANTAFPDPCARVSIQHHHAHVASCLVDNGWNPGDGPVIGVVWDGTGYGLDGHIWGGEFFVGGYKGFRRAAHFEYLPMPGGDAAIRNPWRLALGYGYALSGEASCLTGISEQEATIVRQQVDRRINAPLTSAAGRLFDAVAALIGVRQRVSYEAQAAIEMEMVATRFASSQPAGEELETFPFAMDQEDGVHVIRLRDLFHAVQQALEGGADPGRISWRFHKTMAHILVHVSRRLSDETGLRTVALSGGCFQNRLLLDMVVPALESAGFRVLLHQQVPCNDGGLSLGQAVLALASSRGVRTTDETS